MHLFQIYVYLLFTCIFYLRVFIIYVYLLFTCIYYLRVFFIYVYLLFTDHVCNMYILSHILEKKQNVSIDISNKV